MTTPALLDSHLAELRDRADVWANTPARDLEILLLDTRRRLLEVADAWVADANRVKRIPAGSRFYGEEWLTGPWALAATLNALASTAGAVARGEDHLAGLPLRRLRDGRLALGVFPANRWDSLLLSGFVGEVWFEEGVTVEEISERAASRLKSPTSEGHVATVLGAGNINAIPALDSLYFLIAHGAVVLLKLNPVNDYLLPHLEHTLRPFIDRGALRIVTGGGDVGAAACTHPLVDSLHMTGSIRTYDAIVYGTGEEGRRRKASDEPVNPRPFTAELGNVGAAVVVPGPWSARDIRFQAENLVSQKLFNSGCNCLSPQVIVVPAGWEHTERLLAEVRSIIHEIGPRYAYYPGNDERMGIFERAYSDAKRLRDDPTFLWIEDADPSGEHVLFEEEVFGQAYGVVRLPSDDVEAYLDAAVRFCNERLAGTLGVQLLVHPTTQRALGPALDDALLALRYGAVSVNVWTGSVFLFGNARWGAYPGHARNDAGSGIGIVRNGLLLERTVNTVSYAPFQEFPRTVLRRQVHTTPKPPWFVTHRHAAGACEAIAKFELTRNLRLLPGLLANAMRG